MAKPKQYPAHHEHLHYAVEIKTQQVKNIGYSSNLYIVMGEEFAYNGRQKDDPDGIRCEVTTRVGSSKNRTDYMGIAHDKNGNPIPISGFDPRPNHQHQWEKIGERWVRRTSF